MQKWYFDDIQLHQPRTTKEYLVPEEELIAFAKRWDPLPMHTDREAAEKSPYGGLIAPVTYTMAVASALTSQLDPRVVSIGGIEWKLRFRHPVRPGDRLVATVECIDKRASRTKADRGIARFAITVQNQKGEKVLESESTTVVSRRNPE